MTEVLKAREAWMNLVTQMALKGTRPSEAWERQAQPRLEPQSWHRHLHPQDLSRDTLPQLGGQPLVGPGGHDVLGTRWDMQC